MTIASRKSQVASRKSQVASRKSQVARFCHNALNPRKIIITSLACVLFPLSSMAQSCLLFKFLTNVVGFDTGINICNTGANPINPSADSGPCTLTFYGTNAPTPSVDIVVTPSLTAGTCSAFLLSSVAPGFQGYGIAQCNFTHAAGIEFPEQNSGQNNAVASMISAEQCSSAFPYQ